MAVSEGLSLRRAVGVEAAPGVAPEVAVGGAIYRGEDWSARHAEGHYAPYGLS